MSIAIDIYEHPKAGMYYVVYQHDIVYELNGFTTKPDSHCVCIGNLWPLGEHGLLGGLRFGTHLRCQDINEAALKKIMYILNTKIINV